MINDEVIWNCIKQAGTGFCSFRVKTQKDTFCKNQYNNTGLCNRVSCPLANSNYGTIMVDKGVCYLNLKTIERAHMPASLWEKIKLDRNKDKAMEQIEAHMTNVYPEHLIHRCKKRLERIRSTLVRMRKLRMKPEVVYEADSKKSVRRERTREEGALRAAHVERSIETELLSRLHQGVYGEIYNFPQKSFNKVLDNEADEQDSDVDSLLDREDDDEEALRRGDVDFVEGSDFEDEFDSDEDEESEDEEIEVNYVRGGKKRQRLEVEIEREDDVRATSRNRN